MSGASYSCAGCGATSGSGGNCCGKPMGQKAAVDRAATAKLTASGWGNSRASAKGKGKR